MDDIHDEISRQASGVPPCFTKVPLPFVHKPNLGNEHKELNPLGLFFVLVVVSCTLDLLANFQWAGHWIYHLWYLEYCDLETHPLNIMGFLKIWEGNFKTTKRDPGFLAENVILVIFIPWIHFFYRKDKTPGSLCLTPDVLTGQRLGNILRCFG